MQTSQNRNREPRLLGKVAIVTGGGSHEEQVGTGRATAVCLAQEGAKVLVADVSRENAVRTVNEITDKFGGEASVFTGDTTTGADCLAMVAAAVQKYGGLHVLVNNLGYGGRSSNEGISRRISGIDDDDWDRGFDFNLKSAMLASKHAIPAMIDSGGGSIINFSSCDAIAAAIHCGAPYSVSKGALHMLTKTTAAWHGRDGIRANCIAPGHLHSAYTVDFDSAHQERRRQVVPLGTEGTPWDVAWATVFLASDESRWISGVILPVDGGLFAAQPLLGHDFITGVDPFNNPADSAAE
ncbi:MAG: SDR family oxidoreductase [Fuerstiella sp.]|nr:SDR family oxidoreductase [Fuerstiella sp.]